MSVELSFGRVYQLEFVGTGVGTVQDTAGSPNVLAVGGSETGTATIGRDDDIKAPSGVAVQ